MVTAYYTVKKYCGAGVLITFSDISSYYYYYYHYYYYQLIGMNKKMLSAKKLEPEGR